MWPPDMPISDVVAFAASLTNTSFVSGAFLVVLVWGIAPRVVRGLFHAFGGRMG